MQIITGNIRRWAPVKIYKTAKFDTILLGYSTVVNFHVRAVQIRRYKQILEILLVREVY